jgi:hypothetical protein
LGDCLGEGEEWCSCEVEEEFSRCDVWCKCLLLVVGEELSHLRPVVCAGYEGWERDYVFVVVEGEDEED